MDESFLSQATAPSHSGFNVASEQTTENTTAPMETEPGSEVDELDDGDL